MLTITNVTYRSTYDGRRTHGDIADVTRSGDDSCDRLAKRSFLHCIALYCIVLYCIVSIIVIVIVYSLKQHGSLRLCM